MRTALVLLVLAGVPAVGAADDGTDDPVLAKLDAAMKAHDAAAVRATLAPTVGIDLGAVEDPTCERFAGKPRSVGKKHRAKLAACLATLQGINAYFVVDTKRGKINLFKVVHLDDEAGDANGVEGGIEGGIEGGVIGGVPAPAPPPPPPAPPQNVAPTALEAQRLTGSKLVDPDDVTLTEMTRAGKEKLVASYKLCVATSGKVTTVNQLKSSGFPAYDAKLTREMKAWTYKPFLVNGKAAPVCTAVTFVYSPK